MADQKDEVKTGLVVPGRNQQMEVRPDFIERADRSDLAHVTQEDMIMPRIGLAQKMSPEIEDTNEAKFIPGLKFCGMFNTLTKQLYDSPISFSVIRSYPPRAVEFIPLEQGGGIRDRNVPLDDPRLNFVEGINGGKPIATKFMDFLIMLHPTRELVALSCKSTNLHAARTLIGLMQFRNAVMFSGKYLLEAKTASKDKFTYAVFDVKNDGFIMDKDTYEFAKGLWQSFKKIDVVIDIEQDPNNDPDTFDTKAMDNTPNSVEQMG